MTFKLEPGQARILDTAYQRLLDCEHCAEKAQISGFELADLLTRYQVSGDQFAGITMEIGRVLMTPALATGIPGPIASVMLDRITSAITKLAAIGYHAAPLPEQHT